MRRINKRGFMLIETMIVTVFIMTIFVFIYRNSVPMIGQYNKLDRFDDLDSVYAVNMMKKMVTNYLSFDTIDTLLANSTYADISNCQDTTIYSDSSYCSKLKKSLNIEAGDIVYITRYNISEIVASIGISFRDLVEQDVRFDSGSLSNFRDYIKTVSDNESFYQPSNTNNKAMGVYRLFITRTVRQVDGTARTHYANIGIYKTNYVASSVGETASLKVNNSTLVLDENENFPFTSNLQIQYSYFGGTTLCNPENNATLGRTNKEVTCILTEKNGNRLTATFQVKHGYTPTMQSYEYQCTEPCGCEPDASGVVDKNCVPKECTTTCVGTQSVCTKGGVYVEKIGSENINKCLYCVTGSEADGTCRY